MRATTSRARALSLPLLLRPCCSNNAASQVETNTGKAVKERQLRQGGGAESCWRQAATTMQDRGAKEAGSLSSVWLWQRKLWGHHQWRSLLRGRRHRPFRTRAWGLLCSMTVIARLLRTNVSCLPWCFFVDDWKMETTVLMIEKMHQSTKKTQESLMRAKAQQAHQCCIEQINIFVCRIYVENCF
jgi:hypothetical protein